MIEKLYELDIDELMSILKCVYDEVCDRRLADLNEIKEMIALVA